ncbi:cytochrome P450 [Xylariaceae sp. FL0255]|nr:cytochrome P450 [Xylariaceae sp. FL0255]
MAYIETALFLTLAIFAWTVLHAVFLDPLRGYPGPRIAAISRIPYWIATLRGNEARWMQSLHRTYGPVVRYGPNDLSYTSAQAWRDIYGVKKGRQENPKASKFYPPPASMISANQEEHAQLRRIIAPAFSGKAVREHAPVLQRCADLMVANIRKLGHAHVPVEMVKMYNLTTFDIMGELVYGEPLGMLESSEYTPWVATILQFFTLVPVVQFVEYYSILKVLFTAFEPKSWRELRTTHQRYSADRLDLRLAKGSEKPDVWNSLGKEEDGAVMTKSQMHTHADILMTAGTETSASLLSGLTYLLLTNPRCMEILTSEIRGSFSSSDQIDLDSITKMPYLNACIEEGLRVYPPVPSGFPRQVAPGGNAIMGKWVPPGTCVSVHTTSSYRDPNNFRDPDQFIPERWMGDAAFANDQRDARQPFSIGPRDCLGRSMAWHQMRLLLAKVVFSFDLDLLDKTQDWTDQDVYITWEKKPLMVYATPC